MADPISPARGILQILKAAGCDAGGWHLAIGRLVAAPANMVTIRYTGGFGSEPGIAQDYVSIQLTGRIDKGSGGYDALWLQMEKCKRALVSIPSRPAEYPELSSCVALGEIQDVGYDDQDRPLATWNARLIIHYDTSGYREAV